MLNLQTQMQSLNKIREAQLNGQLGHVLTPAPEAAATGSQAEIRYQQALLDRINDLEERLSRVEHQLRPNH